MIAAQIIFSTLLLSASPATLPNIKHQVGRVLGVKIAQEVIPPESAPPPADAPTPTENTPAPDQTTPTTSAPVDNSSSSSPDSSAIFDQSNQPEPSPTPEPTPAQNSTQSSPDALTTTPTSSQDSTAALNQILNNPAPAPAPDQNLQQNQPETTQPTQQESSVSQTVATLNPEEFTSSAENINPQVVEEVKKEEGKLDQLTDPQQQVEQLVTNSVDKIQDIHQTIIKDDFTDTNFASQRFNDQLDRTVAGLSNLPPAQGKSLKQQLITLCQKTLDPILRNAELSVPEDIEQDLEMNRGRCLALQY